MDNIEVINELFFEFEEKMINLKNNKDDQQNIIELKKLRNSIIKLLINKQTDVYNLFQSFEPKIYTS